MLMLCKNCGRFLTRLEATSRRAPPHPWPLSEAGLRAVTENLGTDAENLLCPTCGRCALVPAQRARLA